MDLPCEGHEIYLKVGDRNHRTHQLGELSIATSDRRFVTLYLVAMLPEVNGPIHINHRERK